MYEYKFVKIELKSDLLRMKPKKDYQQVINNHAKQGWRFKQIFDPSTTAVVFQATLN